MDVWPQEECLTPVMLEFLSKSKNYLPLLDCEHIAEVQNSARVWVAYPILQHRIF